MTTHRNYFVKLYNLRLSTKVHNEKGELDATEKKECEIIHLSLSSFLVTRSYAS